MPQRRPAGGSSWLPFGIPLTVEVAGVEESLAEGAKQPEELARRLALSKAQSVADRSAGGLPVLGADTVVVLDGHVLGKPTTGAEAHRMLRDLRGRSHQVVTGVAVVEPVSGRTLVEHRVSRVTMREYADAEMEAFVASGEAMDKAGAYSIQDPVFRPAASVEGCYTNVMGLPLCTTTRMLEELGTVVRPALGWRPPGPCPECEALASAEGEVL